MYISPGDLSSMATWVMNTKEEKLTGDGSNEDNIRAAYLKGWIDCLSQVTKVASTHPPLTKEEAQIAKAVSIVDEMMKEAGML